MQLDGVRIVVSTTTKTTKLIQVLPYHCDWPKMFEAEADTIKRALGGNCIAVHHIGSTSVPGLAAKPTIDIITVVQNTKDSINNLEATGYNYNGEFSIPFRAFFNKKIGTDVNLHVYEEGSPEVELNILFRDYLRTHPEVRDEYGNLKMDLITQESSHERYGSGGYNGYNLGKAGLIKRILKQAGFSGIRLMRCLHHEEWEALHRIRKEQIFAPINVIYDRNHHTIGADNHYHFVLYKGTDIMVAAHVELIKLMRLR